METSENVKKKLEDIVYRYSGGRSLSETDRYLEEDDDALYYVDIEQMHREADEVLCSLISSLGYDEVVQYYKNMPKWYA